MHLGKLKTFAFGQIRRAKSWAAISTLMIAITLSGCASTPGYAPRAAFPIDQDIKELHDQFDTAASIKGYYAVGADTEARRSEFVAGRLALYDLEYIRFISHFRLSRAEQSTAFDAIALGVGFATTILKGERVKTILGAVTTSLTGARTSYEKNFYDDKTAAALVAQMTAERKKALIPIIQGLKRSVGDYPITTAIVDLADYQMAGTIDGALNGVQQDAAVKDAAAASVLDQYRTSAYGPDGNTGRLRAWLYPGFASVSPDGQHFLDRAGNVVGIDAGRRAMLQAKLQQSGLQNIAPTNLLVDPRLAELRASLVRDIPIP
ncbi:hypothetical protein QP162_07760 [Sphingomonas aurantiaca]